MNRQIYQGMASNQDQGHASEEESILGNFYL